MKKLFRLAVLILMSVAFSATATASPVGDLYDFGFRGFVRVNNVFQFLNGTGEDLGQLGPFTFGTQGSFSLLGNPVFIDSNVVASGVNQETWTISITAQDDGLLFNPQGAFAGANFFAFRTLGFGAEGFSAAGAETNPIFSPTQDAPLNVFNPIAGGIQFFDSNGLVIDSLTRTAFVQTTTNGTRFHANFTNAATSEIRLNSFGTVPDARELRLTYVTATAIPEPSTVAALCVAGLLVGLRRLRRRNVVHVAS